MSEVEGPVLPFPMQVPNVDQELTSERISTIAQLEALLFAAGEPVGEVTLAQALDREDISEVRRCLQLFQTDLDGAQRGLELVCVGTRWQMRTRGTHKQVVLRLLGTKPHKLSRASLETLSIIAYQQPVTRSEIDDVRGVESGGVVKSLLNRNLIRVSGRRQVPGRPLEYGTTKGFLELFGLRDLKALPTLREYEELAMDGLEDD